MRKKILFSSLALFALSVVSGRSQSLKWYSLTQWSHLGGSPNWTDDFPLKGSDFGKVDKLNYINNLYYTSGAPIKFAPGTYVVACRFQKFQDSSGAAPITLEAIIGGKRYKETIEVKHQKVGEFVYTPGLVFTVTKPNTPGIFMLYNKDLKTVKKNYFFDSFRVGKVDLGKVYIYSSLDRRFWGSWEGSKTYYTRHKRDPKSAFGEVLHLNYVWWFAHFNHLRDNKGVKWDWLYYLDPGTYTLKLRLAKIKDWNQANDIFIKVQTYDPNATSGWYKTIGSVMYPLSKQSFNTYGYSPNLTFKVTKPKTPIRVLFYNISGSAKGDYDLDACAIQRGAFTPFGKGGRTSIGGWLEMEGLVPQLGEKFEIKISDVPNLAFVIFGTKKQNIDLGPYGLPGNTLYTDIGMVTTLFPGVKYVATYKTVFPSDPVFLGMTFYAQGVSLDSKANPVGLVFSNGCEGIVEN